MIVAGKISENFHFDKFNDRFRVYTAIQLEFYVTRKISFTVAEPVEA